MRILVKLLPKKRNLPITKPVKIGEISVRVMMIDNESQGQEINILVQFDYQQYCC